MSEVQTTPTNEQPATEFSEAEVSEFVGADAVAGKVVGYLLAFSFVYTIVTGIGIIYWTWSSVANATPGL